MIKRNKILRTFLTLSIAFSFIGSSFAQDDAAVDPAVISAGKNLFSNNCTQCHAIGMQVVGPDLKDVHKRKPNDWLKKFILNSQSVIKSGDKYAVDLYNKFNQTEMPAHQFSDEELNALLAYVVNASENYVAPSAAATTDASAANGAEAAQNTSSDNTLLYGILILVLVILILVLSLMSKALKSQLSKEKLNEDEAEVVSQKFEISYLWTAPWIRGLAITFAVIWALLKGIDMLLDLGVQKGYAPKQPIAFSHKIHAGDNQIDCNYCHTGVRKSKNANIPSANICMNCHSVVKKESPEIQKIYKAIEKNQPIEWVRIHNLPDFAYFNHAQHVKVGGIECQECHGPVETMDVVYQYSDLTMGWCVNCHRDTPLNTQGNAYYDALVKAHQDAKGKKDPFNVSDNGGLECSKCHY